MDRDGSFRAVVIVGRGLYHEVAKEKEEFLAIEASRKCDPSA